MGNKKTILTNTEIAALEGLDKQHFLNPNGRRINKSLGDLTGLKALGFHLIEVPVGKESTELHRHYHEEECVYILEGEADATIGDSVTRVGAGDFIGYPAGGEAHKLTNVGAVPLKCLVAGQRLAHDVADYPAKNKRLFRNVGQPWSLIDIDLIEHPNAGKK